MKKTELALIITLIVIPFLLGITIGITKGLSVGSKNQECVDSVKEYIKVRDTFVYSPEYMKKVEDETKDKCK